MNLNNINKENNVVTKDFRLIQARYHLSLVEQKMILTIISLIQPHDTDFMHYQIPLKTFDNLIDNNHYSRLKQICKDLMSKPLEIQKDDGDWVIFNWFSHIEYKSKNSMLECSISPKLKPYLLELKGNFKSFNLKYILKLQSNYSVRIYEILKKNEKCVSAEFKLTELYDILKVPDSFKRYDNFKRKVLSVAEKDLIANTDIYFTYEEIKTARKVTSIKFKIFINRANTIDEELNELAQFRAMILKEYANGEPIIYHPILERHIIIKNGLLAIEESGRYLSNDNAASMWHYIFKRKDLLLAKPMF